MDYFELRRQIEEKNQNLLGVVLKKEEKSLDEKLSQYKKAYKDSCKNVVPYDFPVLTDKNIWNSDLYKFLKRMPKGSDLHVHGTSLVPAWKLIDFVLNRDDLFIDIETSILYRESTKNENCMKLRDAFYNGYVSRESLIKTWTVLGGQNNDDIWEYFENIFCFHAAIDEDLNILHDYYVFAFNDYVKCNIMHVEIHILLSEDYEETANILKTVRSAYYEVKKDNPDFIVSIIGASMKMEDYTVEITSKILHNVIRAQEEIRDDYNGDDYDFVLGFDLINEEDKSRPLRDYAEALIEIKKEHPKLQYFLHCGESLDPRSDNLIDAYLIKATRVGHGTNLYRYPDLLKRYTDEEICLESCLISNQTLRYTKDIRLHPSAEYLKRGVYISLCSDDPQYQEHEELTDDFFAAVVSWDLGVAEIKQLAINSILYSGIESSRKTEMLRVFKELWRIFIEGEIS